MLCLLIIISPLIKSAIDSHSPALTKHHLLSHMHSSSICLPILLYSICLVFHLPKDHSLIQHLRRYICILDKLKGQGPGGHSLAFTAQSWAQLQTSLHEICGGKSISQTDYFPHTFFIHEPSMQHNLSNWQHH